MHIESWNRIIKVEQDLQDHPANQTISQSTTSSLFCSLRGMMTLPLPLGVHSRVWTLFQWRIWFLDPTWTLPGTTWGHFPLPFHWLPLEEADPQLTIIFFQDLLETSKDSHELPFLHTKKPLFLMYQTLMLALLKEAKLCTFPIRCTRPMDTHSIILMKIIFVPCFYTFRLLPDSYCLPFMLYEEEEVAFFWYKPNYCHPWLTTSYSY